MYQIFINFFNNCTYVRIAKIMKLCIHLLKLLIEKYTLLTGHGVHTFNLPKTVIVDKTAVGLSLTQEHIIQ